MFNRFRWPLVVLTALLLIVGLAPFSFSLAGWVALLPAWLLLTRCATAWHHPFRYGYVIGLIYFGATFWWISNVTAIGATFLIFYLALYPAVWFILCQWLIFSGKFPEAKVGFFVSTARALAGAFLWVTLEWWRSWFLTGFDWNQLGITQATSPIFRQLAALGGVPFLSFTLAAVSLLWAEGLVTLIGRIQNKARFSVPGTIWLALFTVAFSFAYGRQHLARHNGEALLPNLTYACIQPNIPQVHDGHETYSTFLKKESASLKVEQDLSEQALAAQPDLLLWPEAIVDEGVFDAPPYDLTHQIVMPLLHQSRGSLLIGSQDTVLGKYYNAAYLLTPDGNDFRFQLYDKRYLVVLGEYLPFGDSIPYLRSLVDMGIDMSRGPGPKIFFLEHPKLNFAPLICFEETVAPVVDETITDHPRPDFLTTITNDGWYQGVCAQWGVPQHLQNAVFRCVEHDLPLLRCANNGISCEVDQNGTVTAALQDDAGRQIDIRGIFFHTLIAYPSHPTFYEGWNKYGGIVLISELVTAMLGLRFLFLNFTPLTQRFFRA